MSIHRYSIYKPSNQPLLAERKARIESLKMNHSFYNCDIFDFDNVELMYRNMIMSDSKLPNRLKTSMVNDDECLHLFHIAMLENYFGIG
jgi:hypothetical protein